jgi:ribosomal-protein-alanine N-acetyltransferase
MSLSGKYFLVGDRICIRQLTLSDHKFIHTLLNSEGWLSYIGSRNVNTLQDAQNYLEENILKHYRLHSYGMFGVVHKHTKKIIGMCGLILRDQSDYPEIGYAILPKYSGNGYTFEGVHLILEYAKVKLKLQQIFASVHPDNAPSIHILNKIGFKALDRIDVHSFEIPFQRLILHF